MSVYVQVFLTVVGVLAGGLGIALFAFARGYRAGRQAASSEAFDRLTKGGRR